METTEKNRLYSCKDEELPVICGYTAYSFERDLPDFTAFSSNFSDEYLAGFNTRIKLVEELANPRLITVELKGITKELYGAMDSLIDPINRVAGYMKLAKSEIRITEKDFGLTLLRQKAKSKDAEGVLQNIRIVNANLDKHKEVLLKHGLTDELINHFSTVAKTVATNNQKQYEILSQRSVIVQANMKVFNELAAQFNEICNVGKILYKRKDTLKLKEYTFTELKKRVRNVPKNKVENKDENKSEE